MGFAHRYQITPHSGLLNPLFALIMDNSANYPLYIINYPLLKKLPPAKRPRRIAELPELPHKDIGKIDYQAVARHFDEEEA